MFVYIYIYNIIGVSDSLGQHLNWLNTFADRLQTHRRRLGNTTSSNNRGNPGSLSPMADNILKDSDLGLGGGSSGLSKAQRDRVNGGRKLAWGATTSGLGDSELSAAAKIRKDLEMNVLSATTSENQNQAILNLNNGNSGNNGRQNDKEFVIRIRVDQ